MTDGDNNKDDELVRVIRDQSGAERERLVRKRLMANESRKLIPEIRRREINERFVVFEKKPVIAYLKHYQT